MNRINLFVLLVFATILVAQPLCLFASVLSQDELEQALGSERRAMVVGQRLIDAGEFNQARLLLSEAVIRYPDRDLLLGLYGEALYHEGDVNSAERVFMQALRINNQNKVAKRYIDEIRRFRMLSISEERRAWLHIARDKVGDFIVLVVGIWLGTTVNLMLGRIKRLTYRKRARRSFRKGDYNEFTDLMEKQVGEMNYAGIREGLVFMVDQVGMEQAKQIIDEYVDHPEHITVLNSMLTRCAVRKQAKECSDG